MRNRLPFAFLDEVVKRVYFPLGDHGEHGEVDGVDAFAKDAALATAAARAGEECGGILEVVAIDEVAERLARRERLAAAGVHVADLAFGDGDEAHFVDCVLPATEADVHATAHALREDGVGATGSASAARCGA